MTNYTFILFPDFFFVEGGYNRTHVRDYIRLFPDSALALLFKGYFSYKRERLSNEEDSDDNVDAANDEDPMDIILVYTSGIHVSFEY